MNKFIYEKKPHTVEAYGSTYEIPPKTADVIDRLNEVGKAITNAAGKSAVESVKAMKVGVAIFIGEEETERLFPAADEMGGIDTDELSAFWMFLRNESNVATTEVIKKYSPNPNIRK
jgi:hypothetical protein